MKRKIICIVLSLVFILITYSSMVISLKAETYSSLNEYTINTNVNSPYSIEEIMTQISLKSFDDGIDITSSIINVNSGEYINKVLKKPTPASRELGTYSITFKAFDSSGNSSQCVIKVKVIDTEPPKLLSYSKNEYSVQYSNLDAADIKEKLPKLIYAVDNHDVKNLVYDIKEFPINKNSLPGEYTAKISVKDLTGNETIASININIIDDVLPYFVANSTYLTATSNDGFNVSTILTTGNISAYNSNGTPLDITVISNGYDGTLVDPGIYMFTLEIYDPNDSTITNNLDVFVEIIDTSSPYFTLDVSSLVVVNDTLFEDEKLASFIKMRSGKNNFTYEVIEDEYTENYQEIGDYSYKIMVTYEDESQEEMDFIMHVIEACEEEVKEENFFKRTWTTIKKIGQIIWGIIKWPFVKIQSKI